MARRRMVGSSRQCLTGYLMSGLPSSVSEVRGDLPMVMLGHLVWTLCGRRGELRLEPEYCWKSANNSMRIFNRAFLRCSSGSRMVSKILLINVNIRDTKERTRLACLAHWWMSAWGVLGIGTLQGSELEMTRRFGGRSKTAGLRRDPMPRRFVSQHLVSIFSNYFYF